MGRTFTIRWLETGRPVASKHAPALVRALVESGLLDQEPDLSRKNNYVAKASTKEEQKNPHNVQVGQLYVVCDPRDRNTHGEKRGLRVVSLNFDRGTATVENTVTLRKTDIALRRFTPANKGYKLVDETAN